NAALGRSPLFPSTVRREALSVPACDLPIRPMENAARPASSFCASPQNLQSGEPSAFLDPIQRNARNSLAAGTRPRDAESRRKPGQPICTICRAAEAADRSFRGRRKQKRTRSGLVDVGTEVALAVDSTRKRRVTESRQNSGHPREALD